MFLDHFIHLQQKFKNYYLNLINSLYILYIIIIYYK